MLPVSIGSVIAVVLALLLSNMTASAQDEACSIPGVQLASPNAGELVVTWLKPISPSGVPTDYRLSWGPASQDFLSYKDANDSE